MQAHREVSQVRSQRKTWLLSAGSSNSTKALGKPMSTSGTRASVCLTGPQFLGESVCRRAPLGLARARSRVFTRNNAGTGAGAGEFRGPADQDPTGSGRDVHLQ